MSKVIPAGATARQVRTALFDTAQDEELSVRFIVSPYTGAVSLTFEIVPDPGYAAPADPEREILCFDVEQAMLLHESLSRALREVGVV